MTDPALRIVGVVRSELTDIGTAPRQGDEGAPSAWIEIDPQYAEAARDIRAGDELLVLTWLHRAARDVQVVRPRSDPANPPTGVFSTRSPARPNPIGLHRVAVTALEPGRLRVTELEAIDGTPVVDLKPVLRGVNER